MKCFQDAGRWYSFYGVDGIFWDEVDGSLAYYQQLTNFVKSKGGLALSIGNPGTSSSEGAAFDFMITFEDTKMPPVGFTGNYIAIVPSLPNSYPLNRWFFIQQDINYQSFPPWMEKLFQSLTLAPSPSPPIVSGGVMTITTPDGKTYSWPVS